MSKLKSGKWSGRKEIRARVPDELKTAFDAKCKELNLNPTDCLRLALEEFSKKEISK